MSALLLLSNASAIPVESWVGGTSNDWNTAANWSSNAVPIGYNVYFLSQTASDLITFSATEDSAHSPNYIAFGGNGYGLTLGDATNSNGIVIPNQYHGIVVLSSLAAHNTTDTFAASLEAGVSGPMYISNWSPESAAGMGILGTAGYDNLMLFTGNITMDSSNQLWFYGSGDITIAGNLLPNPSISSIAPVLDVDTMGTFTISGTNTLGGNPSFGGKIVFDYTTNNTNKMVSTTALTLGVNSNGGHLLVKGNASSATTQTVAGYNSTRGENSIEVDGNVGAIATLNLKGMGSTAGGLTDFNTNAYGVIQTTNANAVSGTNATNILGPWATFAQTYWATVSGGTIIGLTTDNGSAFNNKYNNFTVTSGGQVLNYATLGANEGANTIRFTSGGTLDLGGTSAVFNMSFGGVMVSSGVTAGTTISDGTLNISNAGSTGFDIYNYGTGTLTISANISNTSIAKAGSGTVVLSGNNSAMLGQQIDILSGTLKMGSATAIGGAVTTANVGNAIVFGDGTATLDTNGYNVYAIGLYSDVDMTGGNQAATAGLNSQILNSKAGTLSTIRVAGLTSTGTSGVQTTSIDGHQNLGTYYGGLNEASGAILAMDIERGTASVQVELIWAVANAFGDPSGGNFVNPSGINGLNDVFTGAITVGTGANLALWAYGNIETTGVLTLNGQLGSYYLQGGAVAAGYLTGTGSLPNSGGAMTLFVDTRGTVTDTFNGNIGTTLDGLAVGGSGSFVLTNAVYVSGLTIVGDTQVTLPGILSNNAIGVYGLSTATLTGTSGNIVGSINVSGGKLVIAPSGSGAAVSVTSAGTVITPDGSGEIDLDKGLNSSLSFAMGSSSSPFQTYYLTSDSTILIGSAQGLSALGNSDKFTILTSSMSGLNMFNGIYEPAGNSGVGSSVAGASFAVNTAASGRQEATFLTYSGTGVAGDAGFMAYSFAAGNINNLGSSTGNSLELVTTPQTRSASTSVFGLEIDKGGSLTLTGSGTALNVGSFNSNTYYSTGTIILNGASITGGTVSFATRNVHIYTDLDNGTISFLNANNNELVKDGAGQLTLTSVSSLKNIYVNEGVLDLGGSINSFTGFAALKGGVLQGSGTMTRTLAAGTGGVVFNSGNGGFSARGGALTVTLQDTSTSTNLVWGSTANFLGQGGVLDFGSLTADNEVLLQDNIDFGVSPNTTAWYSRVINVTANANDTGDPLLYTDWAGILGSFSSNSDPYTGLTKVGTGVLVLGGESTYTGATTISQGTLVIFDDGSLGTAPTAAYTLNTSPGISGNALTPGAIEINGGATLASGIIDTPYVTISSTRQILLASGTTGATAAIIDVAGGAAFLDDANKPYYSTLNFGGILADYINEKGSLEKQGGGTFNYSGTAYNTGTFGVTAGTFLVSGAGSVNSVSGITINNKSTDTKATAQFNYASSVGLAKVVTFGTGGGVFAYNSSAAYTGASTMSIAAKQVIAGSGNLGTTALTIASGGTLMPGNINGQLGTTTVGTLTMGAITLQGGGNYNFLFTSFTGANNTFAGEGVNYSTVVGTSLNLAALSTPFNINLESLNGTAPGSAANFNPLGDYDFVLFTTAASGVTPETRKQLESLFTINVSPNDGATGFTSTAGRWYVYENANDSELILHYSAVPEPTTWAMLLGGLGLLVFIRRSRGRNA